MRVCWSISSYIYIIYMYVYAAHLLSVLCLINQPTNPSSIHPSIHPSTNQSINQLNHDDNKQVKTVSQCGGWCCLAWAGWVRASIVWKRSEWRWWLECSSTSLKCGTRTAVTTRTQTHTGEDWGRRIVTAAVVWVVGGTVAQIEASSVCRRAGGSPFHAD